MKRTYHSYNRSPKPRFRPATRLIVGSLPESDTEAGGGEKGRETLRSLEKLFGRTQSAWQPAQGSETYAVIRRRLFQDLDENGERARKRTVEAFRKLYRDNKGDFLSNTAEKDYEEKLVEAYPVHPMLFDKLSSEWGGLDKFQRTRGVLSLLARTIYASYRDRSDEPLILPSSLRMNDPEVRGALMEPLEGQHGGRSLTAKLMATLRFQLVWSSVGPDIATTRWSAAPPARSSYALRLAAMHAVALQDQNLGSVALPRRTNLDLRRCLARALRTRGLSL